MADDHKRLLVAARRRGYRVTRDGAGHWRVTAPNGRHVTIPCSPRGGKSLHRSRARLRSIGAA